MKAIVGFWPETEVTRRPRFGRDRMKSGHNSDIAEVKRLTAKTRSVSRAPLFDHLVGGRKQRRRHVEAERLRRLEVDRHLKFRRRLPR
jgi:hypothetical protein